jgi:hypothetical protein
MQMVIRSRRGSISRPTMAFTGELLHWRATTVTLAARAYPQTYFRERGEPDYA